jgi:hypothetical protein
MDPERFNQVFNRYGYIDLRPIAMPVAPVDIIVDVPIEVFVPIRNVRRVVTGPAQPNACAQPSNGGVGQISQQDSAVIVEGWAPWSAESDAQGIRILSGRPLRAAALATLKRPDIAERLQDYRFVKSGFKLQVSSTDGKPLRPEDLVLLAFGTANGEVRLACCGCP